MIYVQETRGQQKIREMNVWKNYCAKEKEKWLEVGESNSQKHFFQETVVSEFISEEI